MKAVVLTTKSRVRRGVTEIVACDGRKVVGWVAHRNYWYSLVAYSRVGKAHATEQVALEHLREVYEGDLRRLGLDVVVVLERTELGPCA